MEQQKISVLLIENDHEYRRTIRAALKEAGISARINVMKHGRKTMYLIKQKAVSPDIIFIDIDNMAPGDPLLVRQIRENNITRNTPIIVFSACTYMEEITNSFNSGANMYIPKPVFVREQQKAVQTIFSGNWKSNLQKRNRNKYVVNSSTENKDTLGLYPS